MTLYAKRYGRLLAKAVPTAIKSGDEHERMLALIEGLMAKGEQGLTPEGDALLELLVDLVHGFEQRHFPIPASTPHKTVAFLLEQRGLRTSDLWPVVGSKSRVSEILSGKRSLSKEQAKRLAEFFHVGWACLYERGASVEACSEPGPFGG